MLERGRLLSAGRVERPLKLSRESESPTREGVGGKPAAPGDETAATATAETPHRSGSVLGGRYRIEQV
ncbi:MAG TPA: hypothetical protein VK392_06795, partial [Thermoanaerobaculia bacterium]|nr:hypothetical protein [Thermoanaerobaculia bacterium]